MHDARSTKHGPRRPHRYAVRQLKGVESRLDAWMSALRAWLDEPALPNAAGDGTPTLPNAAVDGTPALPNAAKLGEQPSYEWLRDWFKANRREFKLAFPPSIRTLKNDKLELLGERPSKDGRDHSDLEFTIFWHALKIPELAERIRNHSLGDLVKEYFRRLATALPPDKLPRTDSFGRSAFEPAA